MKNLRERFADFMALHGLDNKSRAYLLAVSGGIDSVVMAHLFHASGYTCGIAHCNFGLRGEASDGDEDFTRKLAVHYGYTFHHKKFETAVFAADNSISIQMAARRLRYQWFSEVIGTAGYDAVAVAHHSDDSAETMLINLIRGTGPAGMQGIRVIHGEVIRPLLFADRKDLESYAADHALQWREDETNAGDDYIRNRIRNQVMPVFRSINPGVTGSMARYARWMEGYEAMVSAYLDQIASTIITDGVSGAVKSISLEGVLATPAPQIVLFHLLKPYGVNGAVCDEILSSRQSGAEFIAGSYRLVRDRDAIIIYDEQFEDDREYAVLADDREVAMKYGTVRIETGLLTEPDAMRALPDFTDQRTAYVNASRLKFPLKVRKWRKGDYFHPLGMKGRKLLSDYFTDHKFAFDVKETVYLLLSDDQVVWVAGCRLDDRYKLEPGTVNYFRFTFTPS